MLEETIKAVKAAELKADETVENASGQAEEIIAKAKTDAAAQKQQELDDANKTAQEEMHKAVADGAKSREFSLTGLEQEIAALKADASRKEAAAVQLLIAELI